MHLGTSRFFFVSPLYDMPHVIRVITRPSSPISIVSHIISFNDALVSRAAASWSSYIEDRNHLPEWTLPSVLVQLSGYYWQEWIQNILEYLCSYQIKKGSS